MKLEEERIEEESKMIQAAQLARAKTLEACFKEIVYYAQEKAHKKQQMKVAGVMADNSTV